MPKSNQKNSYPLFILCLITGVIALLLLPVTKLDTLPIRGGTTVLDHTINSFHPTESYDPQRYLVCSIDDDPEDYNSQGVYHPLDLAVTINNLQGLEIKHLFLGTHLHWPDLETQENGALNTAISALDSCIISVPLRRTAGAVEIPDYLIASSVPADSIQGNLKLLPQVNNLSLAPTFVIPKNTQAGFSQLEAEPTTRKIPLLAIWDDRVILSSLLLERMHHLQIKSDDLKIDLGKQILLGDSGNVIPIDEFGYFSPNSFPNEVKPDIISASITTIKKSPVETPNAILTAAGLKADSFRAINQPVTQLNQLTLTPVVSDIKTYQRVYIVLQLLALIALIYLIICISNFTGKKYFLWFILLTLFTLGIAALVARSTTYYLFTTPLIVVLLVSCVFHYLKKKRPEIHDENTQGNTALDDLTHSFTERKATTVKSKKSGKTRKPNREKS